MASREGGSGGGSSLKGRRQSTWTPERPPVPFPAAFPITCLLSLIPTPPPSPSALPPSLAPTTCPPAVASGSSSQSPPRPFFRPSSPIPLGRSSTLSKLVKFLRHLSTFSFLPFRVPGHEHWPVRAYAARMSFYRLKQFQCEVTGKSGLDYFQAVESERQEAKTMHARFPEPLKPAVLKAVQWRMIL